MTEPPQPSKDVMSVSVAERLDAVCDQFEAAWKVAESNGKRPRIEDYLTKLPESERVALLRELIALDIAYRKNAGENPRPEDYRERFPLVGIADIPFSTDEGSAARSPAPPAPAPDTVTFLQKGSPAGPGAASASTIEPHTQSYVPSTPAVDPVTLAESGLPHDRAIGSGCAPPLPVRDPVQAAPSGTPAPPARKLGEFLLLREIGRGGMGTVFEAIQEGLGRKVAVKVLRGAAMMEDRAIRRFHREAETIARLQHPNIIPIYSVGEQDGTHYYAMKLVQGVSLAQVIRHLKSGALGDTDPFDPRCHLAALAGAKKGVTDEEATAKDVASAGARPTVAYSPDNKLRSSWGASRRFINTAVEMIAQVAEALQHAHSQGVIHRDIKPGNLLLAEPEKLVLMDFGLAHQEGARGLTLTGDFMGTPMYMSPEQATAGRVPIDLRTDIYSLGVTLYHLLTLRAPYEGADTHTILRQVLVKEPPSFRGLHLRLPRDLEVITFKAMEKDPDRRYQSAKEFADDLRRFLNYEAIQAKPPGLAARVWKRMRRYRTDLLIGTAAACLAGLLLFLVTGQLKRQDVQKAHQFAAEGYQLLEQAQTTPRELDADRDFEAAAQKFTTALVLAPTNEPAREGRLAVYSARCGRALKRGDYELAKGLVILLKELEGPGAPRPETAAYERQALGTATWQVETSAPGARVRLERLDENSQPADFAEEGMTPLPEREIPMGNYIVTFSHPEYATVRYPMLVERNEAKKVNVRLVRNDEIPAGMVYVPAGEFWFGDRQTGSAKKVHVPGFFIDRTEVTGADYEKFIKATHMAPPEEWQGRPDCPPSLRSSAVYNVSWFDAMEFARWAGRRLPIEYEWEKAARGVDGRTYPWGNRFEPWRCNCRESAERRWLQVGRFRGGVSPFDCFDMAGNVWEWTADREKPNRSPRIMRGGAAYSTPDELSVFRRQGAPPGGSGYGGLNLVGFRCVKPLDPEPPQKPILEQLTSPADLDAAAGFYWGRQPDHRRVDVVQRCCQRLLEKNPRSVVGNYWKSRCLVRDGKTEEALKSLALVYLQRPGLHDTAEEILRLYQTLTAAGKPVDPILLQAWGLLRTAEQDLDGGKNAEAESRLKKVLSLDPENAVAHEKMAEALNALNRRAEARNHQLRRIQAYRTELKEDPDNAALWNEFADYLLPLELYQQEGLAAAQHAVQLEPENAAFHSTLAEFYFNAKRSPEALTEIGKALALNPDEPRYKEQRRKFQQAIKRSNPR
jgi:serine/threonine protein kinase/formylglycine-generating enzyme required for sulfatase activity/tetratricopeptide (TPR) repeat protein